MADRFWVAGTGVWSDNTNHWSASSGGAPNASKPGAADVAIFDGNSGGGTCTLDEAVGIIDLDLQAANTTTVDTSGSDFAIVLTGNLTVTAGNLTANGSRISVGGNLTIASGLFTPGTSTVILNGSGTQTITHGGESLFNVTVINTAVGGTVFTDATSITGTLRASAWTADILISFDETAAHVVNAWKFTGTGGFSVQLRSQVGANQWDCTLTVGGRTDHVDVQDSNLAGATMLVGDPSNTDSGNNSALWDFDDAGRSGAPSAAAAILFGD